MSYLFGPATAVIASMFSLGTKAAGNAGTGAAGGGFNTVNISGSATSGAADLGMLTTPFLAEMSMNRLKAAYNARRTFNFSGKIDMEAAFNERNMIDREKLAHKRFGESLSIIAYTYSAVEVLELTTGFGPPNQGTELEAGAAVLTRLSEQLQAARPDERWQGSASQGYADVDTALRQTAVRMAELDMQLAGLVKHHAEVVDRMRLAFGELKSLLFTAILIELALLHLPPPAGPTASKSFAAVAAATGMSAAVTLIGVLVDSSVATGRHTRELTSGYRELIAGTAQFTMSGLSRVSTSSASPVSSGESTAADTSTPSGSAGSPPVARLNESFGGHSDHRIAPDAANAVGQTSAGAGLQTPHPLFAHAQPAAPTGTPIAVTMPTLAQLRSMSSQHTKPTGELSDPAALTNHALARLQQPTPHDEQDQQTARPARHTDIEYQTQPAAISQPSAAPGATAAQRAPINTAARATQSSRSPRP